MYAELVPSAEDARAMNVEPSKSVKMEHRQPPQLQASSSNLNDLAVLAQLLQPEHIQKNGTSY